MVSFSKGGEEPLQGVINSSRAESRLARFQFYCARALWIADKFFVRPGIRHVVSPFGLPALARFRRVKRAGLTRLPDFVRCHISSGKLRANRASQTTPMPSFGRGTRNTLPVQIRQQPRVNLNAIPQISESQVLVFGVLVVVIVGNAHAGHGCLEQVYNGSHARARSHDG